MPIRACAGAGHVGESSTRASSAFSHGERTFRFTTGHQLQLPRPQRRHRSCACLGMLTSLMIDQAAALLGVSRRTVYYRIREGRLLTIRTIGGSQRVLLESIQALLREDP